MIPYKKITDHYGKFLFNQVEGPVHVINRPLWWQKKGLMYTSTGYGSKIPTEWMTNFGGRWYRLYVTIYSNVGSVYIVSGKKRFYINDHQIVKD